tara:strand:+ start:83 stop:253 length:171 start_codon:yes stop_codon:yes gene_type:complete
MIAPVQVTCATIMLHDFSFTTKECLNGILEVSGSIPLSSTDIKALSCHERDFFYFN